MRKGIFIISIVVFISSCVETKKKELTLTPPQPSSDFNLKNDHLDFSSKMTSLDTLEFHAELSACMNFHVEKNVFIKKEGKVYIQSFALGDMVKEKNEELDFVEYTKAEIDSLNFEDFFKYLKKKDTIELESGHASFSIVHGSDTIKYFSHDLNDHLYNIAFYMFIKQRLFPNVETYHPVLPPKKNQFEE